MSTRQMTEKEQIVFDCYVKMQQAAQRALALLDQPGCRRTDLLAIQDEIDQLNAAKDAILYG